MPTAARRGWVVFDSLAVGFHKVEREFPRLTVHDAAINAPDAMVESLEEEADQY
jgi:hypothetical protein